MKTFPTPAFIALLRDAGYASGNVSTRAKVTTLPSIRTTLIRDAEPLQHWTTAIVQVDVWAETELEAGELAYKIAREWPPARGVLDGYYVTGGWVESSPRQFDDPDTPAARYLMELGLIVSEENPDG